MQHTTVTTIRSGDSPRPIAPFCNIATGAFFIHEGNLYRKTERIEESAGTSVNAMLMTDGALRLFGVKAPVEPIANVNILYTR